MVAALPPRGEVPHLATPATRRVLLRAVRVYAHCDQCGGSLRFTGTAWAGGFGRTAMAFHKCMDCRRDVTLPQPSPWLEYEEVPDVPEDG